MENDQGKARPPGLPPGGMTGPDLLAALPAEDRRRFDVEFRETLLKISRTFDVEALADVVRRWWVAAGGDPSVARADRARADHDAALSRRRWEDGRPAFVWPVTVDRTGPDVFEALGEEFRPAFEEEFQREAAEAAVSLDHRPLLTVVHRYWALAMTHANPTEHARVMDDLRRVEAGDRSVFD